MPSGTAVNTTWSVICCGWWPAGPSWSTCGTSLPWPYRYACVTTRTLARISFSYIYVSCALWAGRGGCGSVCKQSEVGHRASGRAAGPAMVGFPYLMFTFLAFKNATTADSVGNYWDKTVLIGYFFQGWRTQTAESEGFIQRGAAEDVQQHHRGTERELAKQLLRKHRGRWWFWAVAMTTQMLMWLQTTSNIYIFIWILLTNFSKNQTRLYISAPPAGGSIRQHNPVHPLYLSYQCDIVCLIFKPPVWWSKLLFFMSEFLFLTNVIDRFLNPLPFIHLIPSSAAQTRQDADDSGGRDTRDS